MQILIDGLTGWAYPGRRRTEQLRTVDAAITLTGTLLLAISLILLHG